MLQLSIVLTIISACHWGKKPRTSINILVTDSDHNFIELAKVNLYLKNSDTIDIRTFWTDFEGRVNYDLSDYLIRSGTDFVIVNIEGIVMSQISGKDSLTVIDCIKIDAEMNNNYQIAVF